MGQVQNEMPTLDVSLNILPALQLVEPGPQLPESCGGVDANGEWCSSAVGSNFETVPYQLCREVQN